ncbi:hypothetical protein, partial [Nonomuraea sp. NPDC050202]|uniref:hypothetical protein n=1 Tax=Nonomuraea sp. NPDC050202 TaxID=3155035 RepID=UPI0033FAFAA9
MPGGGEPLLARERGQVGETRPQIEPPYGRQGEVFRLRDLCGRGGRPQSHANARPRLRLQVPLGDKLVQGTCATGTPGTGANAYDHAYTLSVDGNLTQRA